jgi:hypothetical protein
MRENDHSEHDSIGLRRDVIKTTPNRVTALWLFGIFILASATFVGVQIGIYLNGGLTDVAYWFGFFFVLGVSSIVGFLTIVIQEGGQSVRIKIVREG